MTVFKEILKHEQHVTALINGLMDTAIEQKDHATNMFMQWFVTEQVEEEKNVEEVIRQLNLAQESKGALFLLDKEMATRTFVPPAAQGGA
jgi:ferritin